jgi:hypothetical protein
MAREVAMLIGIAFDMPRDDRLDDEAAEIEALRVARIFWPGLLEAATACSCLARWNS